MVREQNERDILTGLLRGGPEEESLPAVQELSQLIERYTESVLVKPHKPALHKPFRNRHAGRRLMKKATHYLSIDTTEALEEAKEEIRTLVSPSLKRMISKSRIVDMALQYVLNELAEKGAGSPLVEHILQGKTKKQHAED